MLLNIALTVGIKSLTKPVWLFISGLSVLALLVVYTAVHGNAIFTVSSLQLNLPMTIYVLWSIWRGLTLLKREKMNHAKNKSEVKPNLYDASHGESVNL
jgi:hypothetical protein